MADQSDGRRLFIDLPGHGKSDKPNVAYTQDLFARAIEAAMTDAGIDKAIVVGHSLGALVALRLAREHPRQFLGLVLVEGSLPSSGDAIKEFARYSGRLAGLRGAGYLQSATDWINTMFVPQTPEALQDEIRRKMLETPQHVMVSTLEGVADSATWSLDPITIPTLVIDAHSMHPTRDQALLRKILLNAEFVSWDEVGHFLMMERPKELNDSVAQFVKMHLAP